MDYPDRVGEIPRVLARSEFAKRMFKEKVERERMQQAEQSKFRARECEVIKRKPFQPILEHNRTKPDDVVLHSTVRANERRKFEEYLGEKNRLKEEHEKEERARQEIEAQEALKIYRRKLEFKARPVPGSNCEPYRPQPSSRLLTVPATPFVLKRSHSK
ncbi:uncharacterized protein LOC100903656 [Galendromus occidentalis]|uniref:Uncharacterized protein LOC100903656 n=1 Tax=Galendromus occidentalis TaxID=34638 RepID=A0AAJ6VY97_9ACAR|nr:uncharacterized protein LOC100903656 [Galendromus occidentalis]